MKKHYLAFLNPGQDNAFCNSAYKKIAFALNERAVYPPLILNTLNNGITVHEYPPWLNLFLLSF